MNIHPETSEWRLENSYFTDEQKRVLRALRDAMLATGGLPTVDVVARHAKQHPRDARRVLMSINAAGLLWVLPATPDPSDAPAGDDLPEFLR